MYVYDPTSPLDSLPKSEQEAVFEKVAERVDATLNPERRSVQAG